MTTTRKSQPFEFVTLFTDGSSPSKMAARQIDGLLKAQAEALDAMESMMEGWLKSRRAGNSAAAKAVTKMAESDNINDALITYFDWLGSSVRRATEDATNMSEQCVSMAAKAFSAGQAAAAEAATKAAETGMAKPRAASRTTHKAARAEKAEAPHLERIEKIKTEHAA
jgi:hypothetical protein